MDKLDVVVTGMSLEREHFGNDKGKFKGKLSYNINTGISMEVQLNHLAVVEILNNSVGLIKDVITDTGVEAIEALTQCDNPLVSRDDKE